MLKRVERPSDVKVWAASSATLGAAETSYLAATTTPLLAGLQRLGFLGAAGLTWSASRDWRRGRTVSEKLDAAGDLLWGVEGMLEFSPLFSNTLGRLAPGVGTVGGVCQTVVGLRRMLQGVRRRDGGTFKLGLLDFASGQLWLAWDLLGWENPVTVVGFVGLMIGREVYANRAAIAKWGKEKVRATARRARRGWRRVKRAARRGLRALRGQRTRERRRRPSRLQQLSQALRQR